MVGNLTKKVSSHENKMMKVRNNFQIRNYRGENGNFDGWSWATFKIFNAERIPRDYAE